MPELPLPKPEEVLSGLASFPPKLSTLLKPGAELEDSFEEMVRSATGVEIPPGPAKLVAQLLESLESSIPAAGELPAPIPLPPGKRTYREEGGGEEEKKIVPPKRVFKEF